jgi:hypothetical protein
VRVIRDSGTGVSCFERQRLGSSHNGHVEELVPPDSSAEARHRVAALLRTVEWPYQDASMASFQSELAGAEVLLLAETIHTLFLHRPDTVIATMKRLLREVHSELPCGLNTALVAGGRVRAVELVGLFGCGGLCTLSQSLQPAAAPPGGRSPAADAQDR